MKKLLIILGAGNSIPVGMPSVSDLDKKMFEWSDGWSPAPGLENYYRAVWNGVEQYYAASLDSIKPWPNFEKVLGEMVGLALHAPAQYREPGHPSPPDIAELIDKSGFEVCSPNWVAIWHSEFTQATRRLNAIVDWLDGNADDSILAGTKP